MKTLTKRILLVVLLSLTLVVPCFGFSNNGGMGFVGLEEEEGEPVACPLTKITDQKKCYDCHELRKVGDKWKWAVKPPKQTDPKRIYRLPSYVQIVDGEAQGYYEMEGNVNVALFKMFVEYVYEVGFKRVLVDISSGGGSLIDGWEICSIIGEMKNRGIHVTTRVRAYCASAAFLILVAGEKRLVEPTAYLMTHELWTLAWLKLETPASKEDEAITMRMFQNAIHEWLAERSGVTKKELDKEVRYKDWWMNGKRAVKLGFADGYIK